MGSPLPNGRLYCVVCLRRRSRCLRLQMSLMGHTRRSAASFLLLRKSMSSTNLSWIICRDEYDDRAFVLIHRHQPQSLWQAGTQRYGADHVDAAEKYAAQDRVALHHASAQCAPG